MSTHNQSTYDQKKQMTYANVIITVLIVLLILNIPLFIFVRLDLWFFKSMSDANQRLLEWLLASTSGTFLYLLWEATTRYRLVPSVPETVQDVPANADDNQKKAIEEQKKAQLDADYIGWTPWYVLNAIRGPIIVMVVMLALTNVSLATSLVPQSSIPPTSSAPGEAQATATPAPSGEGEATPAAPAETAEEQPLSIVVDMSKAPQEVLLIIAFILGMYNRLSVALLESIAERIFGQVWRKAYAEKPG